MKERNEAEAPEYVYWCERHDVEVTWESPHIFCSYSGCVVRFERVASSPTGNPRRHGGGIVSGSTYVRTGGGRMVHRTSCRYAASKSAVPWHWAEGKPPWRIRRDCLELGVFVRQGSCCMAITEVERAQESTPEEPKTK